MKSKLLSIAALASLSSVAVADSYISFDYGLMETELSADWTSETTEAEPSALFVAAGSEINENFAIEAQLGLGVSEDKFENAGDFEVELSQFLAVNLVGLLPLNDVAAFYVKAGLTKIEYEDSDNDKYDGSGLSYGVGAKIDVSSSAALTLEYIVLPDTENDEWDLDIESNSLNFGVEFKL